MGRIRAARLAVLLAAVVTQVAVTTTPASATTVKYGVFQGEATTGPLGYPCTPVGTTDCLGPPVVAFEDPFKGVPIPTVRPAGGNTVGFAFSSTVCAKASATIKPLGGDTKPSGPSLCAIQAAGVVTAFCGLSTARGVVTLVNLGPYPFRKDAVTVDFISTGVAGLLLVTGETANTQIVVEVTAVPAPPAPIGGGGSCTNKTSTTTTVAGHFTVVTKTLP